jgi:hypothetical protein
LFVGQIGPYIYFAYNTDKQWNSLFKGLRNLAYPNSRK